MDIFREFYVCDIKLFINQRKIKEFATNIRIPHTKKHNHSLIKDISTIINL